MKIEDLEGYAQARAEHDGAITAAKAANDELGELRAQLAWRDRLDTFRTQAEQAAARQAATEKARAEARAQYPQAPEVVWGQLSDPEAILAAAKQAHEAIAAAMPTQAPAQQARPWPQPPSGNPGPPAGHHFDDPKNWQEAMEKLKYSPKPPNQGIDNPQFKRMQDFVLERMWNSPLKNSAQ